MEEKRRTRYRERRKKQKERQVKYSQRKNRTDGGRRGKVEEIRGEEEQKDVKLKEKV